MRGWEGKGDPSCQMAEAAAGTSRKEEVPWEVGEVADRGGSREMLERKGKLLVGGGGGRQGPVTWREER